MSQTPAPIPVYAGDDWSFAFTNIDYQTGEPVDLTGVEVMGLLYRTSSSIPTVLSQSGGQTGLIDPAAGKFGIGAPRSLTGTMSDSPGLAPLNILHICFIKDGRRRTQAVFPLAVLAGRDPLPDPIMQARAVIDPLTGHQITFDGPTAPFPTSPDLPSDDTDFDQDGNSLVPLLG